MLAIRPSFFSILKLLTLSSKYYFVFYMWTPVEVEKWFPGFICPMDFTSFFYFFFSALRFFIQIIFRDFFFSDNRFAFSFETSLFLFSLFFLCLYSRSSPLKCQAFFSNNSCFFFFYFQSLTIKLFFCFNYRKQFWIIAHFCGVYLRSFSFWFSCQTHPGHHFLLPALPGLELMRNR